MNILGINAFHGDASACIIQNGELIAAVEEERFTRIKHWAGFPAQSIQYCIKAANLQPQQLDHVAISYNPKANLNRKVRFALQKRPSLGSLLDRFKKQSKASSVRDYLAEACNCDSESLTAQFHSLEHHSTHLACAFNISPFDQAAILSVDGMGDFVSTLMASGSGSQITQYSRIYYPHSLGFLYNAVTLYLGFPAYGDEYKVMGLAPYGTSEFINEFRKIIYPTATGFELNLDYFSHHKKGIAMSWKEGAPVVQPFHSQKLEQVFGDQRQPNAELTQHHQNIAASLQTVTEEIIFHLINLLHKKFPSDNLCLAGGVAMNSVANGKILENTPFKHIYVPVGAADNGTCIGAAFYVWNQILNQPRQFLLEHAYWGDAFEDQACYQALQHHHLVPLQLDRQVLLEKVVDDLCEGKVVGWFQGRMEFGARALGNRSILADPRRSDMRDIINARIKFREKFRPFAPSILEEYIDTYFCSNQPSPFMERVLPIRPEQHSKIPAVTHVDGSGRLQSVSRKTNPLYWDLINTFANRTGIPLLLNTSLNENEPIVRTPLEAIDCFLRTQMDTLVLGSWYCSRHKST